MHKALLAFVLLAALAVLTACSSSGGSPLAQPTSTPAAGIDLPGNLGDRLPGLGGGTSTPTDLETCMRNAGLTLAREAPRIGGFQAVGVSDPAGTIAPGNLSVAVFKFDTDTGATLAVNTLGRLFDEATKRGTHVVAYKPLPSTDLRAKVERCTPA
jgi:hypothetical protein